MGSTFSGIELGKRSIMAHTDAITTAGHNISNANTEGYSRQRVQMKEFDPLYKPDLERAERAGMIGQGIDTQSIQRIRDELLDGRIVAQANQESYWQTRSDYYTMLEQIYNEPADISIRSNMDKFWESWQDLSLNPESQAARQAVVTRGVTLTDSIKQRWESLSGVSNLVDSDIKATVRQVNSYAKQIADINGEIVRSKAMGDNPNDLLDRRDRLVMVLFAEGRRGRGIGIAQEPYHLSERRRVLLVESVSGVDEHRVADYLEGLRVLLRFREFHLQRGLVYCGDDVIKAVVADVLEQYPDLVGVVVRRYGYRPEHVERAGNVFFLTLVQLRAGDEAERHIGVPQLLGDDSYLHVIEQHPILHEIGGSIRDAVVSPEAVLHELLEFIEHIHDMIYIRGILQHPVAVL